MTRSKPCSAKAAPDGKLIGEIGVDKGPAARRSDGRVVQDRKPRSLEGRIVIVVYRIVADDFVATLDQPL